MSGWTADGRTKPKGHATEKGYEDTIPWGRHVEEVLELLPAKRHCIRGPATRDRRPQTDHRALTPFTSAAWIVDTWADPGCLVIDPFAGLGTIGLAARTLGFDYLGAELVPEYAAIANEAFTIERLTFGLTA